MSVTDKLRIVKETLGDGTVFFIVEKECVSVWCKISSNCDSIESARRVKETLSRKLTVSREVVE